VKTNFKRTTRDTSENWQVYHHPDAFFEKDELFPGESYEGPDNLDMSDPQFYNVGPDEPMPSVVISSSMETNELTPIPAEHQYLYDEFHFDLEKWAVFRAMPKMEKFDRTMFDFLTGIHNGTFKVPDFVNTINPPSLWGYYSTLPQWIRDHPAIKNVFMAMEYHKPQLSLRQK